MGTPCRMPLFRGGEVVSCEYIQVLSATANCGFLYIDAIASIYSNPQFAVLDKTIVGDTPPQFAKLQCGIRQGCPLSPFLFVILMTVMFHDIDEDFRATKVGSVKHLVDIWDLEYAGDTVLIAVTHTQLRFLLQRMEEESAHYNMKLNTGKCELIIQTPPSQSFFGGP